MVRTSSITSTVIVVLALAGPANAQAPVPPAAPPTMPLARADRGDLRHHIYVMEGALARAVQFGAQQVNREIRTVSPELFSLAGDAQARGVYLDGYGVFFDVGVPILRQSMMWSFRTMLEQNDQTLRQAIDFMKEKLATERDAARKREVENAIARLEMQLAPDQPRMVSPVSQQSGANVGGAVMVPEGVPGAPAQSSAAPAPAPAPSAPSAASQMTERARHVLKDPNRAYTESVQRALVEAMIDYSFPILLGENEWLTVAARDNEPRDSFAPQDPYEEVVTILLRIKGSDLAAFRAGTIDREEAKRRVQIREF